jgi:hypothetical protein
MCATDGGIINLLKNENVSVTNINITSSNFTNFAISAEEYFTDSIKIDQLFYQGLILYVD